MLKSLLLASGLFLISFSGRVAGQVLWNAGMEGGDLKEWYVERGGGKSNSGSADAVASQDFAHSGNWSAKLTISGTTPAATRLWRWKEARENREAYYSAWYFFPQRYSENPGGWANLSFFKSRTWYYWKNDPFFLLGWHTVEPNGAPRLTLGWWRGLAIEGPQSGQSGGRGWLSPIEIPVGRWFHVEMRYVCAGDFTGAIQVWQDGVEIFKLESIRTRYPNGDCRWAISNYGEKISPSPVVIYADDAVVSKTRLGP
jgi:hypothetical protein